MRTPRTGFAGRFGAVIRRLARRRRQRDRAGIVAAGELDQRGDAAVDARMGVEQFAKTFARVVDAHFHHRGGRAREFAMAFDLAQRRDHGVGIFGEFDRAGVGQRFARARQSKPDQERQHIGDDEERDRDQDRDHGAAAAALVAVARAERKAVVEPQPEHQLGDEGNGAGDDHGDDHHAHVAVADMGELVAQHRFHLGVVEKRDEARGHGDRILPRIHAGGEGVEGVDLHHLELGHGDAARDAEIFQKIIEPRHLLARHLAPAGHGIDHALMKEIGDHDPRRGAERRDRRRAQEVVPGELHERVEVGIDRQRFGDERAGIDEHIDLEEQPDQQRHRAAPVRLDVAVETVGGHG